MARPLRLEQAGARYHLTARGNERRAIFRDEADRQHFVGLLAGLPERFGTRLHAYVLMPNHYHLLLETPEANLSRAGQWLNVSYSVWFNRRHQRSGHLFQGRYGVIIIEDDRNFQEVGRYVHLNPVRVGRLHLDKGARAAARVGAGVVPTAELAKQRLKTLREWKGSSYRAYVGLNAVPAWLVTEVLRGMCGGRTEGEQRRAFRRYVEEAVRQGMVESPWERLVTGEVLGTLEFGRRLRGEARANEREQTGARKLRPKASWGQVIGVVERVKGTPTIQYQGQEIAFTRPFKRIEMVEAVSNVVGQDLSKVNADGTHPGLGFPSVLDGPGGYGYFQDGNWHGMRAFMKRTVKGVNWALVFNASMQPDMLDAKIGQAALHEIRDTVERMKEYPKVDFFKEF